jgi:hypothetical protein
MHADKRQTANARELTPIEGKDQGLWPTVMRFVANLLSLCSDGTV